MLYLIPSPWRNKLNVEIIDPDAFINKAVGSLGYACGFGLVSPFVNTLPGMFEFFFKTGMGKYQLNRYFF